MSISLSSNSRSIINSHIDNLSSTRTSIGFKLSGKGFFDSSNINNSYDFNGIGIQLLSNTPSYKEFDFIDTSNNFINNNYSSLNIAISEPLINIRNLTSNNNFKPILINSNVIITSNSIGIGTLNPKSFLDIRGDLILDGLIKKPDGSTLTSSQWINNTNNQNNIFYNQGLIGIGTNNPQSLLHLATLSSNIDINLRFTNSNSTHNSNDGFIIGLNSNLSGLIWNYENTNIIIGTSNQERLRITSNGRIGIGTTNPQSILDIRGGDLIIEGRILKPDGTNINSSQWSNSSLNQNNIYYNLGNIGIGTSNPEGNIHISSSNGRIRITDNITGNTSNDGFIIGIDNNQRGLIWNNKNSDIIIGTSNQERLKITSNNTINILYNSNLNITSNLFLISGSGSYSSLNFISNTNNAYISFTSGSNLINFNYDIICDILVIGGGGAGGSDIGGGGGAGGVVYQTNVILNKGIYEIIVGNGGNGSTAVSGFNRKDGNDGMSSLIKINNNIFSYNGIFFEGKGGGGGANYNSNIATTGRSGGSGGGGTEKNNNSVTEGGLATQGNTYFNGIINISGGYNGSSGVGGNILGIDDFDQTFLAGGGGGAGGTSSNANGGPGVQIDITGITTWYAAGGGGGSINTSAGIGGNNIGGDGHRARPASIASRHSGINGTGSGGGGGGYYYGSGDDNSGGSGGSGIVIIRIKTILAKMNINGNINIKNNFRINNELAIATINSNILFTDNNNINISNFSLIQNRQPISSYLINNYIQITSNTTINFFNPIITDILLVGAGGNGGFDYFSGGGGAGEIIYYPNFIFNRGIYSFNIGISTTNPINRISKINYINNDIIIANGGGNGGYNNIYFTGLNNNIYSISNNSSNYISFSNNGTLKIYSSIICDILVIGGGGAGGGDIGGGGGAGGVVYQKNVILNSGSYEIIVGNGGSGSTGNTTNNGVNGNNGSPSQIKFNNNIFIYNGISFEGKGGGGGGNYNLSSATAGNNGGSGGGGSDNNGTTVSAGGSTTQGNTYFNGTTNVQGGYAGSSGPRTTAEGIYIGGGGGGAGGTSGTSDGGAGIQNDITGVNTWYAAGGGGGSISIDAGKGGNNIGGDGHKTRTTVIASKHSGTNGTGSGGGGGAYYYGSGDDNGGGAGGSGIVIIRFSAIYNSILPIIGGSGGGGIGGNNISLGSSQGIKNNENFSLITDGKIGTSTKGGDGGSALLSGGYTTNITGTNMIVGIGGTGVGSSGGGINGINYGDGGSGNGGLGRQGVIIIKYPINSNKNIEFTTNFVETSNIFLNNNTNIYIGSNLNIFDNFWNKSQLNENNIIYTQGNIGIGTIRPLYTLDILGDVNISGNYKRNGTNLSISGITFSDERIKNNIIDIDNIEALNKILKITPKKFNYINNEENDNYVNYGFIAQEIKEIISEAIRIQEDFIPNIYNNYKCSNNEIFIEEKLNNEIKKDDIIKIKIENNNYIETKILDISSNIIKIDKEINENNCFIYGKKVNDFHLLDKDYIYTLGISATQELYNRIKKIENKYEEQQDKIKKIINILKY